MMPLQNALVRRHLLLAGATVLLGLRARAVLAAPASLPVPLSLQGDLATALKAGQPLVLMVSLDGCPFCKIAREHYLAPMRVEQGLHVVQINMQHKEMVKDVKGQSRTHEQLIVELKVNVAPTLIFYGRNGAEVAERLVGLTSEDFYGAYLDQRIEAARRAVRG